MRSALRRKWYLQTQTQANRTTAIHYIGSDFRLAAPVLGLKMKVKMSLRRIHVLWLQLSPLPQEPVSGIDSPEWTNQTKTPMRCGNLKTEGILATGSTRTIAVASLAPKGIALGKVRLDLTFF